MNTRTLWTAAAAVVALAIVPSCSSDSDDTTTTVVEETTVVDDTTTETTTEADAAPTVTAVVLQTEVVDPFFDPATAPADKAAVVENGTDRLALLEQFNGVLQGYPLTGTVGDVTAEDATTVVASTEVAGPHGGAPVDLTFIEVDGQWQLADASLCSILDMGRLSCG